MAKGKRLKTGAFLTAGAWSALALTLSGLAVPASAAPPEREGRVRAERPAGQGRGYQNRSAERAPNASFRGREAAAPSRPEPRPESRRPPRAEQRAAPGWGSSNGGAVARGNRQSGNDAQRRPSWQGNRPDRGDASRQEAERPRTDTPRVGERPSTPSWRGNDDRRGNDVRQGNDERRGSGNWQGNDQRRDNAWRNDGRNDRDQANRDRADRDRADRDRADRDRNDGRYDGRRDNDRRWDNDGRRDRDRYDNRNGRNDNRWSSRDNYRDWNRSGWRNDRRYDWRSYRDRNRSTYRIGRYYAPYRSYSYRRVGIGFTLGSLFYGSNYWISDPWAYRLPPVYGPYRWVRYYDDVLLVDMYSGEVVDVIYDFFW